MMNNSLFKLVDIVQRVSHLSSAEEQVQLIVHAVCESIQVDVCSLYGIDKDGQMMLLASQGLTTSHPVVIPAGRGLVGLIAKSRHPLNIDEAAKHPDYYYVALSKEENFHSFCGVPLVRRGNVIGVLVVQREQAVKLDSESEAFLVTLAAHLAAVVPDGGWVQARKQTNNIRHQGLIGAPGIAIGCAWSNAKPVLEDVQESFCADIAVEIQEWQRLRDHTTAAIRVEQERLGKELSADIAGIFDANLMLLCDRTLIGKVEEDIRAGYALPWAIKQSIHYFSALFHAMDDPYLKARGEDIHHLGDKLYQMWLCDSGGEVHPVPNGKSSLILIGAQISVSDIAATPRELLAGIVCFQGSALSHTAVVANALGIPAIMGLGDIGGNVESGEKVILDGNTGQLIRHPSSAVLKEYTTAISNNQAINHQLNALRDEPAVTQDGVRIELFTNTGLLADILPGVKNGAEGVGLYRTEIPFMIRQSFPSEDEQVEVYRQVCVAYKGKPVYFRTLDIGGDKQLPYFPITGEENPALGWRGIRFSLDNIQLLMTQVRAIIRAANNEVDLNILIPMISTTDELEQFHKLLADACSQLRAEGYNLVNPKVGVMIEVPAAISLLPHWADKVDFVSVGSNDLSQYLLAVDRNNIRVANRFDHVHPSIISEIYRIAKIAQNYGLSLSVCGEMASDPVAVILLVGMGVRRLSMSSSKIPHIKWLIRALSADQTSQLLAEAITQDNAKAIRRLGNEFLMTNRLDEFVDMIR